MIKATNKKPLFGNRRSHALNATRHAQKPNLQKITLPNGLVVKMSVREAKRFKANFNAAVAPMEITEDVAVESTETVETTETVA